MGTRVSETVEPVSDESADTAIGHDEMLLAVSVSIIKERFASRKWEENMGAI